MSRRAWPEEWFRDAFVDIMKFAMNTSVFHLSTFVTTNIPELDHRPFPDVSPCTVYDFIVAEEQRARKYVWLGWARAYTIYRPTIYRTTIAAYYGTVKGATAFEVPFDTVVLALSISRLRGEG